MSPEPFLKRVWLAREKVGDFDLYPFCIPAIRHLGDLALHPHVTFFVGENGTGKSTLLEAMAVAEGFNAEGGSRNFTFATRPSHSGLYACLKFERGLRRLKRSDGYFFRAESYFNLATEIDRLGVTNSYGDRSLHEQSHGESFWSLMANRLGGNGLYLFDEPEAALSPSRQLSMLAAMHRLVQAGSQFIIATHSPILMAYPDALLYVFSTDGIAATPYVETEHYRVTKAFLTRKEAMLDELFRE
jgi:predicted ATPase